MTWALAYHAWSERERSGLKRDMDVNFCVEVPLLSNAVYGHSIVCTSVWVMNMIKHFCQSKQPFVWYLHGSYCTLMVDLRLTSVAALFLVAYPMRVFVCLCLHVCALVLCVCLCVRVAHLVEACWHARPILVWSENDIVIWFDDIANDLVRVKQSRESVCVCVCVCEWATCTQVWSMHLQVWTSDCEQWDQKNFSVNQKQRNLIQNLI